MAAPSEVGRGAPGIALDRATKLPEVRPIVLFIKRGEPIPDGDAPAIRGLAEGRDIDTARGLADTRCDGIDCAGIRARVMVGLT